jgi:V/A-type H+-transporting ATPase subunit B
MVMEYKSIIGVAGPLMVVDKTKNVCYGEVVEIETATGERKTGQVLDAMLDRAVVQVLEGYSTAQADRGTRCQK